MSIQTPYARCGQDLVYISERIHKDRRYTCPVCGSAVAAKKGANNAHHFFHIERQDCPATLETLLHATAKHYILARNDIIIQFPIKFFETFQPFFDLLKSRLGVNYTSLSLGNILNYYAFYNPIGQAEKGVGPYIADIRFKDENEDIGDFVIEILVTHEIEAAKKAYLLDKQIPYIEVKPYMNGSIIEFFAESANIPEYFQEAHIQLREELYSLFFKDFQNELLEEFKLQLTDFEKIKLEKQMAIDDLSRSIQTLNLRDYINKQLYTTMYSIPATGTGRMIEHEPVRSNSIHAAGRSLKVNGKYVKYEQRILADLLKNLLNNEVDIHAFIEPNLNNSSPAISGFNFVLPSEQITGKIMKDILIAMTQKLGEKENSDLNTSNKFPF